MAAKPVHESRLTTLRQFQFVGYGLVGATAIAFNAREKLVQAFTQVGSVGHVFVALQVALLACSIAIIIRWIAATAHEFQMLQDTVQYAPVVGGQAYAVIIVLGLTLGVMGLFYDHIVIFALIYASLNLSTMWGQWLTSVHLQSALHEARSGGARQGARAKALNAIETYYFKRPQQARFVMMLFCSMGAALLGGVGGQRTDAMGEQMVYGAYIVMILNIVATELWVTVWRRRRDRQLVVEHNGIG